MSAEPEYLALDTFCLKGCQAALDGFWLTVVRSGTERDGSAKCTATVLKNTNGTGKQTGTGVAR